MGGNSAETLLRNPTAREGVGGAEMGAHFCEFFFRIFLCL